MALSLRGIHQPPTPRELEWGSPLHILSTTDTHGKALGARLIWRYAERRAIIGGCFFISLHLPREASPEAIGTAMALSAALTVPKVKEHAEGALNALLEDGGAPGNSLEGILLDIYAKAQEHHAEIEMSGPITALAFLVGMERLTWENPKRLPRLKEAIEQDLYRGQTTHLTLEERRRELPYMELLSHRAQRYLICYYEEISIEPFSSPKALKEFHREYWREMNRHYLEYLSAGTYSVYQLFTDVQLLLGTPPRNLNSYKQQVGENGLRVLSAWGMADGIPSMRELSEASELPRRLMLLTSAIHRSSHTPLEANLTKVSVNTLIALSDLVEEYNVEWALASFDWERREAVSGDLDCVAIMEERVEGE